MKQGISERILFEDNHLIIVNKESSEIVQGDKTGDDTLCDSVKSFIKKRDSKPGNVFLGITHRLDRPTSGIVIFAKTSKALSRMNALFRNGDVNKTYWAVLGGCPDKSEDTLTDYLRRDRKQNKSFVSPPGKMDAKKAVLSYRILHFTGRFSLAEINLLTGRHHQIRVQFSSRGFPIKGDLKYGARRSDPGGGIHLHARRISFVHPVNKKKIEVVAPVPLDDTLWQDLEREISQRE
jgi:23S rRNA pseudouridine1911/1915/1917 synthase